MQNIDSGRRRRLFLPTAAVVALALGVGAQSAWAGNTDIAGAAIGCSTDIVEPAGEYTCSATFVNLGPNPIVPADKHKVVIFDSGYSDLVEITSPSGSCTLDGASPHCDFASVPVNGTVDVIATMRAGKLAEGFEDSAIFESIEVTDPNHSNDRMSTTVKIRRAQPPGTALSRDYRKLTRKRAKRASWKLTATVPGSAFACSVDAKRFRPCGSPVKARGLKRLTKRGKHKLCVRAIAPDGAVDPTPACDRFRVK